MRSIFLVIMFFQLCSCFAQEPIDDDTVQLEEVVIQSKSKADELKESPYSNNAIEAKQYYTQSSATSDIINKSSGVRVRQSGGLGSAANFSINGVSGKQIRFLLDGIPLDYYGSGMDINVIPINQMERIEIFKGAVPIELGSDALGGAINIVSRKSRSNFADLSYSYGSFNTHKANLNSRLFLDSSKIFVGMMGFYNHSDNNFKVDVEIPNHLGNPEKRTTRRFHDRYSNYMGRLELGMFQKKFADELILGIMNSGVSKQIQHNLFMSQPFGQATFGQQSYGLNLKYVKYNLWKNLNLESFFGYNRNQSRFIDTTLNVYNWDGRIYTQKQYGGEISTSMNDLRLYSNHLLGRINASYQLNDYHSIVLNSLHNHYFRKGRDPVAADYYQKDIFATPVSMYKQTTGISHKAEFLRKRLVNIISLKFFYFDASGFSIDHGQLISSSQRQHQVGYSEAIKYQISPKTLIKASYEYATRLPDEYEMFGDFYLVQPNASLVPERSHNGNVGIIRKAKLWSLELSSFYRFVDKIIYLRTAQNFAQYQNLLKAEITGIEGEIQYKPFKNVTLSLNATYQDLRSRTPLENSGTLDARYIGARLPNIPYFFGNAELRYVLKSIFKRNNPLQVWWNVQYTNEFYLYWSIDGRKDSKYIVPSQLIQSCGLSYTFYKKALTLSGEAHNLLDTSAYDNFGVQRPGLSFSIKVLYNISK
jgi:outer membrane receptor protein involved in Fe transport